eukprot:885396-Prymnesium_polylepis.1
MATNALHSQTTEGAIHFVTISWCHGVRPYPRFGRGLAGAVLELSRTSGAGRGEDGAWYLSARSPASRHGGI